MAILAETSLRKSGVWSSRAAIQPASGDLAPIRNRRLRAVAGYAQGTGALAEGDGIVDRHAFDESRRNAADEGVAGRGGVDGLDDVRRQMALKKLEKARRAA